MATQAIDDRVREREQSIVARPPQIPPLKKSELSDEAWTYTAEFMKAAGLPPEGDPKDDHIATMLRHPDLLRVHTALAIFLMAKGALAPRDRELAVLRTAWLCGSPYEWGEHVALGKRLAGLTSEEIARARVGSAAEGLNDHDRTIFRAVEEMHEDAKISDETWTALAADLDYQQLLELPILVGQYQGVAYLLNSARIRMNEGNPGFSAR
jgi:4-carboxymuconolactone decarboxylase